MYHKIDNRVTVTVAGKSYDTSECAAPNFNRHSNWLNSLLEL